MAHDYLESKVGNMLLRGGDFPKPTSITVVLYTTMPLEDGTGGVPVSGNGYLDVEVPVSDTSWSVYINANGDKEFTNNNAIVFPTPGGSWGIVKGYGLKDGPYLLVSAVFSNGDKEFDGPPLFTAGSLKFKFGNYAGYTGGMVGGHLLRSLTFTKPAALYLALFSVLPDKDGNNGVEFNGNGYGRIVIISHVDNWSAPVSGNGLFKNEYNINFGIPTGLWGPINGVCLLDETTGGNLIFRGTPLSQKTINVGVVATFLKHEIQFTFS
ncbi:MAG: hypothetical protein KAH77_11260 [Thiomargarita sp.]|nr:hypothetical protein [Thiomargarita sp.]